MYAYIVHESPPPKLLGSSAVGKCYICSMRQIAAIALLATSPAWAGNFATCVLDKMPGTQNDVAAVAIYQVCRAKHGSSRPWRRARGAASSLPIRVPSAPPKRPETPAATGRRSLSGRLVGSCMTSRTPSINTTASLQALFSPRLPRTSCRRTGPASGFS